MEKLRVLIAEDDALVRDIYDACLNGLAFDKTMVDNGQDALRLYKELAPELIVLDSVMPTMTGYAALKELRRVDKTIPVIIVTSLSKGDDVMAFIKLGICGYIVKPFEPEALTGKILAYLGKSNLQRAAEIAALNSQTLAQWSESLNPPRPSP